MPLPEKCAFRSQAEVSAWLRTASVALAVLGMLGVAASAAVSLTGEREQDTWISLATTLLTPAEVIRAKQFGAVWMRGPWEWRSW